MNCGDLKKLKDQSNLTTKQISDLSGIPESTISRILSGQTDNPAFDTVCAIVKAMGGSLDRLTDTGTDSDSTDVSALIALYEKIVSEKNRYIKMLITFCWILVAVIIFVIILDTTNGTLGFIRY